MKNPRAPRGAVGALLREFQERLQQLETSEEAEVLLQSALQVLASRPVAFPLEALQLQKQLRGMITDAARTKPPQRPRKHRVRHNEQYDLTEDEKQVIRDIYAFMCCSLHPLTRELLV